MQLKRILLFILILSLVFFSGCTNNQMKTENIESVTLQMATSYEICPGAVVSMNLDIVNPKNVETLSFIGEGDFAQYCVAPNKTKINQNNNITLSILCTFPSNLEPQSGILLVKAKSNDKELASTNTSIEIVSCEEKEEIIKPVEVEDPLSKLFSQMNKPKPTVSPEEIENQINECNNNADEFEKQFCIGNVAIKVKDPTICEKIQGESQIDWCYSSLIGIAKDESYCDNIKGLDTKNFCLASLTGKATYCDNIESPLNKDICYSNVAASKQDKSICENVKNADFKEECEKNVFK